MVVFGSLSRVSFTIIIILLTIVAATVMHVLNSTYSVFPNSVTIIIMAAPDVVPSWQMLIIDGLHSSVDQQSTVF